MYNVDLIRIRFKMTHVPLFCPWNKNRDIIFFKVFDLTQRIIAVYF